MGAVKFNPDEYRYQHYVPVFWQKRFRDSSNNLFGLKNNNIRTYSPDKLMAEDWIYTTFDSQWNPSNKIEFSFNVYETRAGKLFDLIENDITKLSSDDEMFIRWFIALSICRHPDSMKRTTKIIREIGGAISLASTLTEEEFLELLTRYHVEDSECKKIYEACKDVSGDVLRTVAENISFISPTDPDLPAQLSVDTETVDKVVELLSHHDITVIDAPARASFILGDTPFPTALLNGFTIPISSRVALKWKNGAVKRFPQWTRRMATGTEVCSANQQQYDDSLGVVVGSSRDILEQFKTS